MPDKNPIEVVGDLFPLDGPHSHRRTVQAANCLAEMVRYLNYATRTDDGVPYPATVYDLIGNVRVAVERLDQTLRQSADRLVELAGRPDAGQSKATDGRWPSMPGPRSTALTAGAYLETVWTGLAAAREPLNDAQVYAGRLYLDAGDDDA